MPPRVYMSAPRGDELQAPLFEQAALAVLEAEGILEGELSLTFLPDEPIRGSESTLARARLGSGRPFVRAARTG